MSKLTERLKKKLDRIASTDSLISEYEIMKAEIQSDYDELKSYLIKRLEANQAALDEAINKSQEKIDKLKGK